MTLRDPPLPAPAAPADSQVCTSVHVLLDDASAMQQASTYLAPWATAHSGTNTPVDARLRLESCGQA